MKKLDLNQMENLTGGLCTADSPGNSCFAHCNVMLMVSLLAGDNFPRPIIAC